MTILHNTLINREVSGPFGGKKIDRTNLRGRLPGRDQSVRMWVRLGPVMLQ
jgi:hypothetical protein